MIRPLLDVVIIRRDPLTVPPDYKVKPERVILPRSVLAKALWGTVIAIGPRVSELVPGDRVNVPWRWQRPVVDEDWGEVELLRLDEILLALDEELECVGVDKSESGDSPVHYHTNAIQRDRCRKG